MNEKQETGKKTLMRLIAVVLIFAGVILCYKGCEKTGNETRSYHKVYKDSSGTWQGRDVSYEADAMDNAYLLLIGVPVLIGGGILAFASGSSKKPENRSGTKKQG